MFTRNKAPIDLDSVASELPVGIVQWTGVDPFGTLASGIPLDTPGLFPLQMGDVEASPAVTSMLNSDLLRCHHDTEIHGDANADVLNGYDVLPQKGFDEGTALTVNDAFVVRVPKKQDKRSKAARHGAKTPMTSDAQGMFYPALLGPSFQQGHSVTSAQGQTTWVEGKVEEKAWQPKDSVEQLRAKDNLIPIPNSLEKGYRTLLAATEADWERGSIQRIMCQLCLGVGFKTWESFKHHCDTTESHPLKITFCHSCGDFFARRDSLKRHRSKPPPPVPQCQTGEGPRKASGNAEGTRGV